MSNYLSNRVKIVEKSKKRLGRGAGSGKGQKSTRGSTRHQKARENISHAFEGGQGKMTKRFPLLRGKSKNKSIQVKANVISMADLETFDEGTVVTVESLIEKGMVVPTNKGVTVKVLANGKLTKKLTVALPVSESARKMIEDKGGEVRSI